MTRAAAFGDELRRHRERRGVLLDTIARDTKINAALLRALERGDCSRWPGGVYSRAYIRSYADAVGLDAKQIADEFCRCFPHVAWPEGKPGAGALEPAGAGPPAEPLRLSLDMPPDRWRAIRTRLAAALPGGGASVAIAAAASLAGADFWVALSTASLTVHAISARDSQRPARQPWSALRARLRTQPAPAPDLSIGEPAESTL